MRKFVFSKSLIVVSIWGIVVSSSGASVADQGKGRFTLAFRAGLSSFAVTEDPQEKFPFPLEGSFEIMVKKRFGVGGTITYDRWKDVLGVYGGRYTFRVVRSSVDLMYHLLPEEWGLDLSAGGGLGCTFLSVSNELGNKYEGDLKNELFIGPILGGRLNFWKGGPSFLQKVSLDFRLTWSVAGDFSGLFASAGISLLL